MRKLWMLFAAVLLPGMAHATISGTTSTAPFTCTNSTGPYQFTFPALDVGSLIVLEQATGALPGVYIVIPSNQWTGTPVNNSYMNGGRIVLTQPCPTGYSLTIVRATEPTQLQVFTPYMPALYQNFENGLDQLTAGRQDTFRVDQVHVGTLATATGCGSGSANVTYTPLGQYLNITFPTCGTSGAGIPPGYLPVNLLSCSTSVTPIAVNGQGIPVCTADDTPAIQACFNNNFNATIPVAIYAPPGCYLIDGGQSLVIGNTFESHFFGDKNATILRAGASLSGKPLILHENNFHGIVESFNCQGTAASPPSACIESRVACPISLGGNCTGVVPLVWPQNQPDFSNITIGSLQPSGGFANGLMNGIVFDHDLNGCPGANAPSCDLNNDQSWLFHDDIGVSGDALAIVGGNSEEHKIIGGTWAAAECIDNTGGSFQFNPKTTACATVVREHVDTNVNDFPYLKPRQILGGMGESVAQLWITDPSTGTGRNQQVSGEGSVDHFDCEFCGPATSGGYWIDWESGSNGGESANFNYSNGVASLGRGGLMKFTDPLSIVRISNFRGTPNAINFANALHGDTINIQTSSFSGFIYTGSGTRDLDVQNWQVNGVTQPPVIDNLQIAGGLFGYGSYSNLLKDSDWQEGNPSGGSNTYWANHGTTSGSSTTAGASTDIFQGPNAMTITAGTLATNGFYGVLSSASNEISVTAGQTVTIKVSAKSTASQNLFATIFSTDPNCQSSSPGGGQLSVTLGTSYPATAYSASCTFSTNTTAQMFVGTQTSGGTITVSHAEMTTASGFQLPVITTTAGLSGTGQVVDGRVLPVPISVGIPVAFASLGTCVAALEGTTAAVKDSTTVTWGATITGGGTNHVLAYCDNSAWTVAAK